MSKLTYKVSYYVLYALFAAIIVVLCLFYFGGDATGSAVVMGVDPDMWQPAYSNALLYLIYTLLGITIGVTVIAGVAQFSMALKDNPANALKSLIGVIALAAVLVVSWMLGSDQPLNIQGYEGTDNVPFWLKITDMLIYTIYFLFGATVVAIIASSIWKRLS